jgi:glycosyltransferase involved in cell wall biosynthesis
MTITVITATYNRCNLLRRVYESLRAQQSAAIEWIVVDDGGSDATPELMGELAAEAPFSIRYIGQENAGKPRAVNHGLDLATGDLVCVLDDDDWFLPGVFAQVVRDYAEIARDERIGAISYLTVNPEGRTWGVPFPHERKISNHFEYRINGRTWGDKCEFTRLAALSARNLRYFEMAARGGIGGDSVFFLDMAEHYDTLYVNKPVLVKDYQPDGISVNWRRCALKSPLRTARYYKAHLNVRLALGIRLRYMIAYKAILFYAGKPLGFSEVKPFSNRLLLSFAWLPGLLLGARWKRYNDKIIPKTKKWMRDVSRIAVLDREAEANVFDTHFVKGSENANGIVKAPGHPSNTVVGV